MYDAVIVGARCAGAATALLLAEAGHRVLVVDRAALPSDIMSTRYIHQPGVARLREWGVLPGLLDSGCRRLTHLTHTVGSVSVSGLLPEFDGVDFALAPRRILLDQALGAAAEAAGAEFRTRTRLTGLTREGKRVTGVRLRCSDGSEIEARARVVVGADGMRSTVARLCAAAAIVGHPRRSCVYYSGWHLGNDSVRLVEAPGRYLSVIPTDLDLVLIATYAPQDEFVRLRTDPMRFHRETLEALAPDLHERLRGAEPALRLRGTGDQRNFLRQAAGPGWALVGDAGHHKDSITARGITDAFEQAEVLAGALAGRIGSDQTVDAGLAEFAQRRDDLILESYATTLATAELSVTDRRVAAHKRIQASAALTDTYMGVLSGIRSAEDLLEPPGRRR